MQHLEALKQFIPEAAKDLRINLGNVLTSEQLSVDQTWGVALASAFYLRDAQLIQATLADALVHTTPAVIDDAKAAAALMGMNTVFYRFRHMVGKADYAQRPARLRVQRLSAPATDKASLELMSLACAALAGCEQCIRAHEEAVLHNGLRAEQVQDAIRIAAVFEGVSVALALPAASNVG